MINMVYFIVIIVSLTGIVSIFTIRGILRSRNARRIVRSVKRGISGIQDRNVKLIPDTEIQREATSPRARAIELQEIRTLLHQAEHFAAKQDFTSAERTLIKALTIKNDSNAVKSKLARIYLDSHREHKAEALLQELLQKVKNPDIYSSIGLACYKQGKFMDACNFYQESLNMDPKNPERSYDLGKACMAAQRFREAVPLLRKAAKSMTKDIELLHLLAQCYMQLGDMDNAENIYREINRLDPRDKDVKDKIKSFAASLR